MQTSTFEINNRRYLGSKYKLIDFIHQVVDENCKDVRDVLDLFAGTGVVGYSFNSTCNVSVNDMLSSNYIIYHTFFGNEKFSQQIIEERIEFYNRSEPIEENYYSLNFADTYLSYNNMKKVGFIRDDIDKCFETGAINAREKDILICSLIYAIDKIANTVGHYDAYRKDGNLNAKLVLSVPKVATNEENRNNKIFMQDANELVRHLRTDLVYIDPPYNSRQYCDSYHFLENVAINKKPEVFGVAKKMDRSNEKSQYCTSKAPVQFADLIEHIDAKYILVSYSDTGKKGNDRSNAKINDEQIMEILGSKGDVQVFERDYNIFTTGKTKFSEHKERLFLCTVGKDNTAVTIDKRENTVLIKSPLNYTGGKFKILNQLKDKFPSKIGTFYDVFCGGANVGINMDADKIICIDNNAPLIHLLEYLQKTNYYVLIEHLENLIYKYKLSNTFQYGYEYYDCSSDSGVGQYNKEAYSHLKNDYNCSSEKPDALFLLLIIYGFNNQIRFNNHGQFNLPVGKRDLNAILRKKLEQFTHVLKEKNIVFKKMDFREIDLKTINTKDDFLYLDPPYSLGTASYNENKGWTDVDDKDLFEFLKRCDENKIRFALSNVIEHKGKINTSLADWALENQFNINYISRSYSNANYHIKDKKAITKEVLITNY